MNSVSDCPGGRISTGNRKCVINCADEGEYKLFNKISGDNSPAF